MLLINCNRLDKGFELYQNEYETKVIEILRSGWYILGNELRMFEEEFADYLGASYCIGVASGLDALKIAVKALKIGENDEVIVPANTYIATVMGITENGAKPVFVEPDEYYNINTNKIEGHITDKTKAIMVVHLYGQAADMDAVMKIARKYDLRVIEDCAQAHGASWNGKKVGTFGDIGCFSFYPTKNLGAFGDGGAIVTNSDSIDRFVRMFRNYGSEKKYENKMIGYNSRLDELQAGLLRIKLSHIEELIAQRQKIAELYLGKLKDIGLILPKTKKRSTNVWHQFVVRCQNRDKFISDLKSENVNCMIHYPIPPHLSEAYSYLNYGTGSFPITESYANEVVSLPIYDGMTVEEAQTVINKIMLFHR